MLFRSLQVSIGEGEGVEVFSRADFLLTPTAGGKPIAIYTDGWEYHRGRLAKDAEQRMALQRSGNYLFWALTWDDVVEKLPSAQKPLQPNGLEQVMPAFTAKPELFSRWWSEDLQNVGGLITRTLPAREAQIASSLELLMQVLVNPSERWWQGLAQQLCQAQLSPKQLNAPEIQTAIETLELQAHVQEWQHKGDKICGQVLDIAQGLKALNLGDMAKHQSRNPGASFRTIHFDPELSNDSPHQQAIWREWIRQANLFQFLPHLIISTPGWSGAEQNSAINPYEVWIDESSIVQANGQTIPSNESKEWQTITSLIAPACRAIFQSIRNGSTTKNLLPPQAGFELEGSKGEVIAEAELAWPDQQLAVVTQPEDVEAFEQAGWRCWLIDDSPDTIVQAILAAL